MHPLDAFKLDVLLKNFLFEILFKFSLVFPSPPLKVFFLLLFLDNSCLIENLLIMMLFLSLNFEQSCGLSLFASSRIGSNKVLVVGVHIDMILNNRIFCNVVLFIVFFNLFPLFSL